MNVIASDRQWHKVDGASSAALDMLLQVSPIELPLSYLRLLAFSNGGEGPLAKQPYYFQLDSTEITTDAITSGLHDEFFKGFIMIGSNGGGEFIAFDGRKSAPWPVVALDMTNSDIEESILAIAPDFDEFLGLIGLEPSA